MKHARTIVTLGLLVGLCYGPARADEYLLTGTVRVFDANVHPDFENDGNGQFSLIQGMVKHELGADGKPVLNVDPPACYEVFVTSSDHELSNVVLRLNDGTEDGLHYKYDDLSGYSGTFLVPDEHQGTSILGVWVKAGPNSSDDGPGYGTEFDGEYFEYEIGSEEEVVQTAEGGGGGDNVITVTFYGDQYVDPTWRIESELTFNQWFRNDGPVAVVPGLVQVSNGLDHPGGIYRFQRTGASEFYPSDGTLAFATNANNDAHRHFTYEIATKFDYTHHSDRDYDMRLEFASADDMWVFINGRLVVDLGGCHQETHGSVNLDSMANQLGLQPGNRYDFHVFFAQRHTDTGSNIVLETNFPLLTPPYD